MIQIFFLSHIFKAECIKYMNRWTHKHDRITLMNEFIIKLQLERKCYTTKYFPAYKIRPLVSLKLLTQTKITPLDMQQYYLGMFRVLK